jgi:hypothetical protein
LKKKIRDLGVEGRIAIPAKVSLKEETVPGEGWVWRQCGPQT